MGSIRGKIVLLAFCGILFGAFNSTAAQDKPWSEWDKKAVEKMLNSSAWGQTQAETDTSEMMVTFGVNRQPDSANNQAFTFNYRIRFFSALPVREAFARKVLMDNPGLKASQLANFVNGDYSETIVVAVSFDGPDRRYLGPIGNQFTIATTENLSSKVFLEKGDGKRLALIEYAPPSSDGTGAKFVFPRIVDGKPFLAAGDESVRFIADMGKGVRMSWRFKASEMNYKGKLEY